MFIAATILNQRAQNIWTEPILPGESRKRKITTTIEEWSKKAKK